MTMTMSLLVPIRSFYFLRLLGLLLFVAAVAEAVENDKNPKCPE